MRARRQLLPLMLLAAALGGGCTRHVGESIAPSASPVAHTFVVQRDQVYTPADWPQPLQADVYTPSGTAPAAGWPAVVVIHGGAWHKGSRKQGQGNARRLAARGYVALNIEYRLVPDVIFPAQVQDVQQAVRWLRANAARLRIDPTRIGAWGYSSGAHLAALTASLSPGDRLYAEDARLQAVVGGGTPTDLRKADGGGSVARFLGERWRADSPVYAEASPAAHVSADDPPVFLYHGTFDTLVPVDQATDYQLALEQAGVPNELVLLRGLGHATTARFSEDVAQQALDFLDRHLRDASRSAAQP